MECDVKNLEEKTIKQTIDFKGKKVLEIGCSSGRYAEFIVPLCKKYVGIDINFDAIKEAQNNFRNINCKFLCGDFISYNFQNEKFDIIVLCLTFHEIIAENQGIALLNILNLLEKNGKILIVDPTNDTNSFQALFNIGYNEFKLFNHNLDLQHSQWVLEKAEKQELIKLLDKKTLHIDFTFENEAEITDMLINDVDLNMLDWNAKNTARLSTYISDFINANHLKTPNGITVYDKLCISVFEKNQ